MARHAVAALGARNALHVRWRLRTLLGGSLTREQQLLDVLAGDGEPRVARWARTHRDIVRDSEDLLQALERLQAEGGPVARSLAATIWLAWRDVGGR